MLTVQLIGDSLARRFGFYLARSRQTSDKLCVSADFSVSGLTISGLKDLVKAGTVQLNPDHPVVMFIGTNDVLRGSDPFIVKQQLKSLVRLLRRRFPEILLVLVEIPDFPKIQHDVSALAAVKYFNKCLLGFHAASTFILRIANELADEKYFCKFYGNSNRRDGIHYNDLANKLIQGFLVQHLSALA